MRVHQRGTGATTCQMTSGSAMIATDFAIDAAARDAWMGCMRKALAETVADDTLRAQLDQALTNVANHMRNQNEADEG